jgi:hypothetical protein
MITVTIAEVNNKMVKRIRVKVRVRVRVRLGLG